MWCEACLLSRSNERGQEVGVSGDEHGDVEGVGYCGVVQHVHRERNVHALLLGPREGSQVGVEVELLNAKREFISDIWGKRGTTYGEKGVCRRIKKTSTRDGSRLCSPSVQITSHTAPGSRPIVARSSTSACGGKRARWKRRGGHGAAEMARRRWRGGDGAAEMGRRRWGGGDGAAETGRTRKRV